MSAPDEQGGAGRREVAYRLFAAEYDDADLEHSDSDEDRAPNYVVTPTGARVNRLFIVGVLTEVESVSENVLRARIVDPTGAFVLYAGQYQPDAQTFLERAEPPAFVAVTGKARTFQPEDADAVYTSVRPESMNEVDADTRDRWTVQTAEHTLDRVAIMGEALDLEERGVALREALLAADVDAGLAAGIPLALAHYGTSRRYLAAVRDLAVQAAEVVAGERDEVEPLDVEPGASGPATIELEPSGMDLDALSAATAASESAGPGAEEAGVGEQAEPARESASSSAADGATSSESASPEMSSDRSDVAGEEASAELYEMDAEEREQVEEEYGTEFSTGTEVDDPGEADIAREPATSEETAGPAGESDAETSADSGDARAAEESAESESEEVDLENAVVEAMQTLDEGDGAPRQAVVDSVVESAAATESAVEDAIDDALMSGRCYQPDDDTLKAI